MKQTIFKGQVREYNPETQKIEQKTWRQKFTRDEVVTWMENREKFLFETYDFDDVTWRLWEDGCYRMTAYRNAKTSKKGRPLKQLFLCFIFRPVQK